MHFRTCLFSYLRGRRDRPRGPAGPNGSPEHLGNFIRSAASYMLPTVPQKLPKRKRVRPPRIRVPNNEPALFTVDARKLLGLIQRLSLTGGSVVLSNGPIPQGTLAEMELNTVCGRVTAHIEFLHNGADGMPIAQAFRFLGMDDTSSERFDAAARQMQGSGFSDAEEKGNAFSDLASKGLSRLRDSIRRLSEMIDSDRTKAES